MNVVKANTLQNVFSCAIFTLVLLPAESVPDELCVGAFLTEDAALKQLDRFRATFSTLPEWERRAAKTRHQILTRCGLGKLQSVDERSKQMPLNPVVHSTRTYDGYSVASVAFEALPGFFVYGSIYAPLESNGRLPGVLCPHGHGKTPNGGGRYRPNNQLRCASLARMGAIVLSYDMIGYGDSGKVGWEHRSQQTMPLQLWSSIRAIDYLVSRDDLNPDRIGITGASGGGTQTFLLAAVDDRVAVSVPTVMVSAHFFGGCVCESGHPIHKTDEHETNNTDIAACAAPKPQLLISVGGDWTKNTPEVEYPYIQDVYSLFNAKEDVANAHFADEQHDYGPSKQAALFSFMARHLKLDESMVDPEKVTIEDHTMMQVVDQNHPLPDHAITSNSRVSLPFTAAK